MAQKTAVVLLSTYNGEKYVGQQLDSIVQQDYPNIELYVRDDGSTDGTKEILQQYAERYPHIHLVESNGNLGYPACFFALMNLELEGDYFFFADQDDVWKKEKISRAVSRLEKEDEKIPVAYYAGYHVCNQSLEIVGESPKKRIPLTFKDALFDVCGLEFTMGVNRTAKEFLATHKPQKSTSRGPWMSLLYTAFGKVIYDEWPCAMYRRHTQAVTASNMSFFGLWKWRIRKFFGGGFDTYKIVLQDFYQTMGDELPEKPRKTLRLFAEKGYWRHVLGKVFYPKRLRQKWTDELGLRFVFLIGKL